MMTERVKQIFAQALEKIPAEREPFLAEACAGDAPLRQEVESLLAAHQQAGDYLQVPVAAGVVPETMLITPLADVAGTRIGRYKLLQQIGEGGCGMVYMAEQQEPVRRQVALKVIKLGMDTKNVIARFEVERQALALMDHPNIAKVLDAGATDTGRPYFVMELVRGIKITSYCDQHNLPAPERLLLFIQVCQAVQHAHQKGIMHRDIKPSNVLVTLRDGVPVPKVIDFGIAKATTDQRLTDKTLFTAFEQFIGTPAYMSPEQAEMSELGIDTRSDIYSLGVLLYELLTGKTPFEAQELLAAGLDAMRRMIREQEPLRPSTRLSAMQETELTTTANQRRSDPPRLLRLVRGDLDWIVMKTLEKDRTRRYETANGLAEDIQRHLDNEPVVARPQSQLYRFQRMIRRNKLAFAAGGAVGASLLIGLVVSTWLFIKENEAVQKEKEAVQDAFAAQKTALAEGRRAVLAAREAKITLSDADFLQATRLVAAGKCTEALAYLSASLSADPANEAAVIRLAGLLMHHSWWCPSLKIDAVNTAEFSPDGSRLVTAASDGTVRVWDAYSGQPMSEFKHGNNAVCARFSPNGKLLVTAAEDGTVRIWDARGAGPQMDSITNDGSVLSARFSPDGTRIVTAASDGTVRVWNALNGRRELEMKHERGWNWGGGNDSAVSNMVSAEFSPDGKRIFSITSGNSHGLRIWDAQNGRRVEPPFLEEVKGSSYDKQHTNEFNAVYSVQFSPVGNRLAVSCAGLAGQDMLFADVLVCDEAGDKPPIRIVEENVLIGMAQFSPDGRQIVTVGDNGTVRAWDSQTGQPVTNPLKVGGRISVVQFSPDGKQVLTIDADGVAEVWEERSAQSQPEILKHGAGIVSAHFNPDGTRIVTAGNDGIARIWDVAAGQPVLELKDGTNTVTGKFSSDGRRILTIASNSEARVWDAQSGRRMMELGLAGIDWAEFSPDGSRIVTVSNYWVQGAGATAAAQILDAESGQPVTGPLQHNGHLVDPQFSPDGTRILTRDGYGPLQLWDARNGKLLMPALGYGVIINGAKFSPDGTRVVTVPDDGIVRVWNTQSGREQTRPMAHLDSSPSIALCPDGNRLITASPEDGVQIWDAWTGQPLMAPLDRDDEVCSAEYSSDGELILSISPKTGARIWDARTGEPLTEPLGGASCRQAELSPDGRRMLVQVNNEEVQVWDVSPFQEKLPGWVFELLEALSGRVLNKQGILEESRLNRAETLKEIGRKLSLDSSGGDWSLLGRWYLADPTERTVSPFRGAGVQPSQ